MNEFFREAGYPHSTPMTMPKKKDKWTYEKPAEPKIDTSGLQSAIDEEKRRKAFDQKMKTNNPRMWHE